MIVGGFAGVLHGSSMVTRDLDVCTALSSENVAKLRAASIEIELFGRSCRVISLQDLIRAKEALGRDKDLLAAKELRAIAEKQD